MTLIQEFLALGSGVLVGFSLGLIGGGGSILAVPLLLYVVGVTDPHRAIGTSALAVAANAFMNLVPHAKRGNVRWVPAGIFAAFGVIGATWGSTLGKAYDGHRLLILFALLMIAIALLMLRKRGYGGGDGKLSAMTAAKLAGVGLSAGLLAGFFGIGGGFLVVPGLILATGMPMISAVGSSLLAVGAFGSTTAINYALSGMVDWLIAVLFITGGIGGGWIGAAAAGHLAVNRTTLTRIFAAVVIIVAVYMLSQSLAQLQG